MKNLLIQGDNLWGLHHLLNYCNLKGKIDLVYIDPPFATGTNFTITKGRASTVSRVQNGQLAYPDKVVGKDFLNFLKERLVLIQLLLSKKGSIYLHVDYKIGHYVKILMDEVFGIENFRNDITRIKCNPKNFDRTGYGNMKDLILFYSKLENPIWNEPRIPYTQKDLEKLYPKKNHQGRHYTTVPIHAPGETKNGKSNQLFKGLKPPAGRHWRTSVKTLEKWDKQGLIEWSANGNPRKIIFADERDGKRVQDIWEFKDPLSPIYPTEKNKALLDLIVKTSSNKGSIVLDCFCGSGTTLKSAQLNGRNWIGMDQSPYAIKSTRQKIDTIHKGKLNFDTDYTFLKQDNESFHYQRTQT